MPTGHTAAIMEGRDTTLETFVMSCCRSFGICITMRDDPADTPIPDEFEVEGYYFKNVEKARQDLAVAMATTLHEAEIRAHAEFVHDHAEWKKRVERRKIENQRLDEMKARVEAWNCPELMKDLKPFMLNQLTMSYESGRWDSEPVPLLAHDWLTLKQKLATEQLAYHEKQLLEAQERVNGRNQALAEIRASLKGVGA